MSTAASPHPSTSLPDLLGKFSQPPHADIILRSSDSHDFRVQRLYVVDSSPVLGEKIMAATCHGTGPETTSEAPCDSETTTMGAGTLLPVIQLPESFTILSSLLTFVFPVPSVLPPTIEQILELLSVAQKYEMNTTVSQIRDRASRRDPPFVCAETALDVYSLAWKYGLFEEALLAAEETLKSPMTIDSFEDKFGIIPNTAVCELWSYRLRVLKDFRKSIKVTFSKSEVYQTFVNPGCLVISTSLNIPLWLKHYLSSVVEDPTRLDFVTFHLARSSHVFSTGTGSTSDGCERCMSISGETLREFWTALTATFHESIRKARSDFSLTQEVIRSQRSINATEGALPLPEGLSMLGADVILQSSDLVFFRVHKSILAISSPVFSDMFSLPQPRDDALVDGLPIVQVSEDAEVLQSLLTVLYPIPSVIPDSYKSTLALLAAFQKYNMATALSTVRSKIGCQLPTMKDAFHVYAIASSKQLVPEMEAAARLALDHPMTFGAIADALPLFEGSALQDLVHFRKRCRNNLLSFFQDFVYGNDDLSKAWSGCPKTKRPHYVLRSEKIPIVGWLRDLILRHIKILQESYTSTLPNPSSLRKEILAALRAHISETHCPSCSMLYAADGEALREQLLRRALEARDKEPLRPGAETSNSSGDHEIS